MEVSIYDPFLGNLHLGRLHHGPKGFFLGRLFPYNSKWSKGFFLGRLHPFDPDFSQIEFPREFGNSSVDFWEFGQCLDVSTNGGTQQ